MKRATGLLWLPVIVWLCIVSASAADVLTNDVVVAMVKAGLGDEVVIGKIKISQNQFDLSTQALLRLKEDGVGPAVIKAMVETAACHTVNQTTWRTRPSPRCCCTSQISSSSPPSKFLRGMRTAWRIEGSFPPEKSISTTGPITCTILPSVMKFQFVERVSRETTTCARSPKLS